MSYSLLLSETAVAYLRRLSAAEEERVVRGLRVLEEEPRRRRSGADIRRLAGTSPPKFRLRVGPFRAVYVIEGKEVRILDIFRRGRGYR